MTTTNIDLIEEARKQKAAEDADFALQKVITGLVLSRDPRSVFFSSLIYQLERKVMWEIDTIGTNGTEIVYNPDFVNAHSHEHLTGIMVHEVSHCVYVHPARLGDRDPTQFNIAGDLAINPPILAAGYKLPDHGCFPGKPPFENLQEGLCAEDYYSLLPPMKKIKGCFPGDGNDPGKCGGIMKPNGNASDQEAQWKQKVAQAEQIAKQRGTLPADLQLLCDGLLRPDVDWREVLREFVSVTVFNKDDYNWSRCNRRFVSSGLYLPSLHSESVGRLCVHVDTSGSTAPYLELFAGSLQGILECSPAEVTVVYCDCQINKVEHWHSEEGELKFSPCGGGGTSHVPVWDWLKEQEEEFDAVISLTDGATDFGENPGVPVLWVLTEDASPPFGKSIRIKASK